MSPPRTVRSALDSTPLGWSSAPSMVQPRSDHTATLLPGGKVLIVGGKNAAGDLASAELYDPAARTWSTTGALSQARTGHTATLLNNGKVLVTGGRNATGHLASAELYDLATGSWASTGSLSEARADHIATLLADGKVLVTGGKDSLGPLASAKVYDPATGTWSPIGSLTQGRSDHTATVLPNGKVLVTGGKNTEGSLSSSGVYDPVTRVWSAASSLAQARTGHTATLLPDGTLLVAGGGDTTGHLASSEVYAPAVGAWSPTGSLTRSRSDHTATVLPGGRVLVTGGRDATGYLSNAEVYDMASHSWSATDALAQARTGHTATLLPDGKVLVAGGKDATNHLASVEVYAPAAGAWSAADSLKQGLAGHTATVLADGKVLVAGGRDAAGPLASARLYDPVARTWSPTGSLTEARSDHTATVLTGGKVLVVGGRGAAVPLASARLYDPATRVWSTTGSLAQARTGHTATLLADGKVLVTGGKDSKGPLASAEVYNPVTGTWSGVGSFTQTRSGHTATLLAGGKVLVVGGGDATGNLSSATVYDPATRVWSATGSLTQARMGHAATLLPDGKVLVTGGDGAFNQLTSAEVYDPVTGTWASTGSLTQARTGHTATLLPDGKVLVAGGYGTFNPLASTEVYDPATGTWSLTGSFTEARTGHTATLLPGGKVLVSGGTGAGGPLASTELYDAARADYTAAPGARITAAPATQSNSARATFSFTSRAGASFECSLDGVRFSPCVSPASYEGLAEGAHLFQVRTSNVAGNGAATPAWRVWTVDLTPPETTLSSTPASPSIEGNATFGFATSEASPRFECSLDGGNFSPCDSPVIYTGLGLGTHEFLVRAVDAAGNVDPTPAFHPWNVINDPTGHGPPPEDLDALTWSPQFEPDYNTLQAHPWVEVATPEQAQTVIVKQDKLIFPKSQNPEVLQWEEGRVVVAAPSEGSGANPLGFARKVRSVTVVGDTIEVLTDTAALEDLVTGELQLTFDYSQLQDVDLSKLDLEWASKNLYVNAPVFPPDIVDPSPDNHPLPQPEEAWQPAPGDPFFSSLFRIIKAGFDAVVGFVGGAVRAVINAVTDFVKAVTAGSFSSSMSVSESISSSYSRKLFEFTYQKPFQQFGRTPVELSIRGTGEMEAGFTFRPGVQVGVRVPNILSTSPDPFAAWLNVDSQYRSNLQLNLQLDAEVAAAGGVSGSPLRDKLSWDQRFAQDVLSQARENFMGDPDMRPAGVWSRNLFITKPAIHVLRVGVVPVVITQTFQVDLECGFDAKAGIKANISFEHASNLRFNAHYESGGVKGINSTFESYKNSSTSITGGGSARVACGLVPRVNVFVYDSVGLNAGVRGTLVASATYASKCEPGTLSTRPKGEVGLKLSGDFGIQAGARVQVPFSSFLGSSGLAAGKDIGPFEFWHTEFPIYENTWYLNEGLGYCSSTCRNWMKDELETDVDCGGGACGACADNKLCRVNTDCAAGYCSAGRCSSNHCGDGVRDGDETGIDCGGSRCGRCGVGVGCFVPTDCASGFCAVNPASGSDFGQCVQNHCSDYTRNTDESGIDCGGTSCPKCAVGARSAVSADCASGYSDGQFCVPSTCMDRVLSSGESDIDCGGTSSCSRCREGRRCGTNADCSTEAPVCDPGSRVCSMPRCGDNIRNGDETDTDCGGSCSVKCAEARSCVQNGDCAPGLKCDSQARVCTKLPPCGPGEDPSQGTCVGDSGIGYISMKLLQCAAGQVAVGIYGRQYAWTDKLGLLCAPFQSGQVSGSVVEGGAVGGEGGLPFSYQCPQGEVLYKVDGINGWDNRPESYNQPWCNPDTLSGISIWCANPMTGERAWRPTNGAWPPISPTGINPCEAPVPDGEFSRECEPGQYITGLGVDTEKTSTYVGHVLEVMCR